MRKTIACLLLCACVAPAVAGDIYQWTDENGKRHFGETVPERYKKSGGPMTLKPANIMPAKNSATGSSGAAPTAAPHPAATEQKAATTQTEAERCREAQRRYQESVACFENYRNHNGSLKPGAAENCQSLPQPTGCTSP